MNLRLCISKADHTDPHTCDVCKQDIGIDEIFAIHDNKRKYCNSCFLVTGVEVKI